MTRINTNVSSLIAQKTLSRSNSELQTSLTRLSTGLRINTGKDDPAGLIASENLRRDITSIEKAITNSERANQLIATADSALGQVSSLLNDIRGLVVEAANTGALSDEQIAANQLQVDASLEAIDRIAQVTTFQGRKLLDGSLDFLTSFTAGQSTVTDIQIDQANLGATGSVSVDIAVSAAATQASLTGTVNATTAAVAATGVSDLTSETAADGDTGAVSLVANEVTTAGNPSSYVVSGLTGTGGSGGSANEITVAFAADGDNDAVTIEITSSDNGGSGTEATFDGSALVIDLDTNGGATTVLLSDIETAVENITGYVGTFDVSLTNGDDTTFTIADLTTGATNFSGGVTEVTGTDTLQVTVDSSVAAQFNGSTITFDVSSDTGVAPTAAIDGSNNIVVTVDDDTPATLTQIQSAIEGLLVGGNAVFSVTIGGDGDGSFDPTVAGDSGATLTFSGGNGGGQDVLEFVSDTAGATANGTTFDFNLVNGLGATPTITDNGGGSYTINVDDATDTAYSAIKTVVEANTDFTLNVTSGGDGYFNVGQDDAETVTVGDGSNGGTVGTDTQAGILADLTFKLSGTTGSEVFSFDANTSLTTIVAAINLVSDSTGVTADGDTADTLTLSSSDYGSDAFVDIEVLTEGSGGVFEASLSDTRANGTDIQATVNGFSANGDGNTLSLNTTLLDLSLTVSEGSTTSVSFDITGGGALFQLGPDVVSNQQARIGIDSLNTAQLGGVNGRLYELRSGSAKDLSSDPNAAASVVDDVINKVTSLRGRLGAFQKTTLETNIFALNDTLANLTETESSIRDADFAKESAALTRAQILVQSGTSVLGIANSNPQNVLGLLR